MKPPLLSNCVAAVVIVASGLGLLGCASGQPAPTADLAVAGASVSSAELAGAADAAPAELASARSKLSAADAVVRTGDNGTAARLAEEAEADARLAEARSREAGVEKALTAVRQGNEALRNELGSQPAR